MEQHDVPTHRAPVATRRRLLSQLALGAVGVGAGVLFAVTARQDRARAGGRSGEGLPGLLADREERITQLTDDLESKRAERDQLQEQSVPGTGADSAGIERIVGLSAVEGPAVRVSLTDAPPTAASRAGVTPNDLVVHQQDLEGYINALWEGGAEAMSLQDQRVVSGSAFRCVGNTLLLEGRVYSPPFTVTAIGDPARMLAALDASPGVIRYRQWKDVVGLGESIEELSSVRLPAYSGSLTLTHVEAPGD